VNDEQAPDDVLSAILSKAGEKLEAAERELAAGYPGEASSRAYYAVFHSITAVLATKGLSFSSHAETIGRFNRDFVKTGVFPADTTHKIQRLFENRQTADYDWLTDVDADASAEDVADARDLVEACREYVTEKTDFGEDSR
jgi:uncharacterized protein (UPF0332 family)